MMVFAFLAPLLIQTLASQAPVLKLATVSSTVVVPKNAFSDSTLCQSTPLTTELVHEYGTIAFRLDTIRKTYHLRALAKSRGLVKDTTNSNPAEMYTLPEATPAFKGMSMSPQQFVCIQSRLNRTWAVVNLSRQGAQQLMMGRMLLQDAAAKEEDVTFFTAHEDVLRSVLGLPPKDNASAPSGGATTRTLATVVLPVTGGGSLQQQLKREVADTRAHGQLPIVEITDRTICVPCLILDNAMEYPPLIDTFKDVRLIKISPLGIPDEELTKLHLSGGMPSFSAVNTEGLAVGDPFGVNFDEANMEPNTVAAFVAPQIKGFLAPLQKK